MHNGLTGLLHARVVVHWRVRKHDFRIHQERDTEETCIAKLRGFALPFRPDPTPRLSMLLTSYPPPSPAPLPHSPSWALPCVLTESDVQVVGYVVALMHVATMGFLALLGTMKVFRTYRGWHSSGLVIKRVVVMEKSNVAVSQNPLFIPAEQRVPREDAIGVSVGFPTCQVKWWQNITPMGRVG